MDPAAERLPHVDEHAVEIAADAATTWEALLHAVEGTVASGVAPPFARLLGCADTAAGGPRPLAVGSAVPGFHVASCEPGAELGLAGSHRFSDYALIFRLDEPVPGRTRVRAETRAAFPGLEGRVYRALVIGTRMHVLATRRVLTAAKRRTERDLAAAQMPDVLEITPTESLAIRPGPPGALEVEATYRGGEAPPKHFHPSQDEHFEVLAGSIQVRLEGVDHRLGAGAEIDVPRGAVHQIWNSGPEPARVLWRTTPAGRTEDWFRAIDRTRREGRVDSKGMPGPLAFGVMLTEYRDVFRLAGPDWLVRPALVTLGAIGRARGYRANPS
jgi:quercetin dioxygenase-like cupin family protein